MKRFSLILPVVAIVIFWFIRCTSESEIDTPTDLKSVLELELTFGAENFDEEFLLFRPYGLTVNDSGDIFIADEKRVKVYDKSGKEKSIIGRPGQGPGEFYDTFNPMLGPTGYLTVSDYSYSPEFHVFNPDFKFYKRFKQETYTVFKDILENITHLGNYLGTFNGRFPKVIALNKTDRVGHFVIGERDRTKEPNLALQHEALAYIKDDKFIELHRYNRVLVGYYAGGMGAIPFMETLQWGLLPGNRIIYSYPSIDKKTEQNQSFYVLYIVNYETLDRSFIRHQYKPVEIPETVKNEYHPTRSKKYNSWSENDRLLFKEGIDFVWEIVKDLEYYDSMLKLLVDGNIVFVVTYQENDSVEYIVNIFDPEIEKYVKSVCFSIVPEMIKNGYAYRTTDNEEGFKIVEKYKIDPIVYEK